MTQTRERRFLTTSVRSADASGKKVLTGYAARFNTLSADLGGWRERLAPGCFRACLSRGGDVMMLADHNSALVLGRQSNKSLEVSEDAEGLRYRCELPDTSTGRDVYELTRRGDLREMSFAFSCDDQSWDQEPDPEGGRGIPVRTVKAATITEISIVAFPAYPNTSAAVDAAARSLFPTGLMPVEIRSRINKSHTAPASGIPTHLSNEEYLERLRARDALARLDRFSL
jgi:hypothetical protein